MGITVVTHSTWKAEFLGGTQHFGLDIPSSEGMSPGKDGFWTPGHFASLMYANGDRWRFTDTPWWEWTDRVRFCRGVQEAVEAIGPDRAFVKLARHKLDSFPARVMTGDEFLLEAKPGHDWIVAPVLELEREWRVITEDGAVIASSCYRAGDWWWDGEGIDTDFPYASFALGYADRPGARVLDIGETAEGNPVLVEANPAWCAGWYGMPAEPVIHAIIESQNDSSAPRFIPDPRVADDASAAVARMTRKDTP